MAERERDPVGGYLTTGHEWDGIKELTTPIPGWWVTVFIASCAIALVYMWLYPSFPATTGFYHGFLGWTSKGQLAEELKSARAAQADWRQRLMAVPLEKIEQDDELRRFAVNGSHAAFNENCAPCHGVGAGGQNGQFPSLIDDDWLWGGKISEIQQTIQHGIRNDDPDTRQSIMPTFGEILSTDQIDQVADYVLTLSDPGKSATRSNMPGSSIFAENCSPCHGEQGQGNHDVGAPRLNDTIWLYGGSKDAIKRQVTRPRMGVMPPFGAKLDESLIRMLAVYVHTLGGGER